MRVPAPGIALLVLLAILVASSPASAECVPYGDYLYWLSSVYSHDATFDVAVSGHYAYLAEAGVLAFYNGIQVADIADPAHPRIVADLPTPGLVYGIAIFGTYAYLAEQHWPDWVGDPRRGTGWSGLQVVDISDPLNPRIVASMVGLVNPGRLAISGTHAYIADGPAGLRVVDIADPTNPRLVATVLNPAGGSHTQPPAVSDVAVSGNHAYFINGNLEVVDISEPEDPRLVGAVQGAGTQGIAVSGTYAFVTDAFDLRIVDISNPAHPIIVTTLLGAGGFSINISETVAWAPNWNGIRAIDISSPEFPNIIAVVETGYPYRVVPSGEYAYVADYGWGLSVLSLGNLHTPPILGSIPGIYDVRTVAVSGSHAYLTAGDSHFHAIDVADPHNPYIAGSVDYAGAGAGLAVSGRYAFIGGRHQNQAGMLTVDVLDPQHPQVVGGVALGANVNGIAVSGDYAYVTTGAYPGYLKVVRITNATAPVVVGSLYLQEPMDLTVSGSLVYIAAGHRGLQIVDVTVPTNPVLAGQVETPGNELASDVAISGSLVCLADWYYGFITIDASDPAHPRILGTFGLPSLGSGVALDGTIAYTTDWESGMTIIDISEPEEPSLLGRVGSSSWYITKAVDVSNGIAYVATQLAGFQVLPTQCVARGMPVAAGAGFDARPRGISALPNPMAGGTAIRFELRVEGPVRAEIYDVSGRLVREWDCAEMARGVHDLHWDRRDNAGRKVAPGVYQARVTIEAGGAGSVARTRIVVVD